MDADVGNMINEPAKEPATCGAFVAEVNTVKCNTTDAQLPSLELVDHTRQIRCWMPWEMAVTS
jgi:hypothetical protein